MHVREILSTWRSDLRDAVTNRYSEEHIDRCYATVLNGFSQLATRFAYLVGRHVAGERGPAEFAAIRESEDWRRLVGANWDRFLTALEPVVGASTPIPRGSLDATVTRVAGVLRAWLEETGFSIEPYPGGRCYFRVLLHISERRRGAIFGLVLTFLSALAAGM